MRRIYYSPSTHRLFVQEMVEEKYKIYILFEGSRAGAVIGTRESAQIFLYVSTNECVSKKVNGIIYTKKGFVA